MTPLPSAAPEEIGLSSARLATLSQVMRGEIERGRVPGAVALIARRGRVGFFESFGQRDPAAGAPMAKDTIFRIYSMTKPITSMAAMMLWEEGRFLLGDPVAKYLPEFSDPTVAVERGEDIERVPAERAITIQDLLRHTSGLTYEFRGPGPVRKMYMSAKIYSRAQSSADQVATLLDVDRVLHRLTDTGDHDFGQTVSIRRSRGGGCIRVGLCTEGGKNGQCAGSVDGLSVLRFHELSPFACLI